MCTAKSRKRKEKKRIEEIYMFPVNFEWELREYMPMRLIEYINIFPEKEDETRQIIREMHSLSKKLYHLTNPDTDYPDGIIQQGR